MTPAWFINSGGRVVPVPAEQVPEVTQLGWVPASPKQIEDAQLQEKYGGQAAIAGLESAGSALTFGMSTAVERKLGVPAADISGREKANPVASGLGTAAGVVLPLIATFGASAPASGGMAAVRGAAELTAPALIARAGRATTEAASALLPAGESMASRIAARAASLGFGSAVEGAAYGAGQVVHEAALGDPNLTAESALATAGVSAALAGGVGMIGGALSGLFKHAGPSDMGAKVADWLGEFEGERNIKAAGGIQSDIAKLTKQKGRAGLVKIGQEMGEMGLVGPLSTPASTMEKARDLMQSAGGKMRGLLTAADAEATPEALPKIGQLAARVRDEVIKPLAENPLQQTAAKTLNEWLTGYETKFLPGMDLEDLHGMRQQIDEALYGYRGNMDPAANALKSGLRDFRRIVSDELQQGMERVNASSAEWKAVNRVYEVASTASTLAQGGIDRTHGNNLISLTEGLGALGGGVSAGPVGAVATGMATAAVRRHAAGTLGFAARTLRGVLEGSEESLINKTGDLVASARQAGADLAATNAPETVAALSFLERNNQKIAAKIDAAAKSAVRGAGQLEDAAPALTAAEYADHSERFQRFASDPSQLQTILEQQAAELDAHAPKTAQALQVASARAASFLASKIPQHPAAGPLAAKWEPTSTEREMFSRYYEAIERPMSVLKQASDGTLTPEAVEAVRAVYPALFAKMQASIVDAMTQGHVSGHRLMLSMLLGQDVDGSLNGAAILASQAQYQMPPAMPAKPMNPGKVKFGAGQRAQTDLERTARRGVK